MPAGWQFGLQLLASAAAEFVVGNFWKIAAVFALHAATKAPDFPDKRGYDGVVKTAVGERVIVYGEAKVGGVLAYAEPTGNKNKYMHLVILLAGHEVEAIGSVYFDDVEIATGDLDGSGNVTAGTYSGKARIKKHLGTAAQAADSDMVSELGVQEYATLLETDSATYEVLGTLSTNSAIEARKTGTMTYDYQYLDNDASYKLTKNGVDIAGTEFTGASSDTWLTKNESFSVTKGDLIRVLGKKNGTGTASVKNRSVGESPWTSAHTLSGIAYLYIRLEWDPDIYPTGLPDIKAIVQGKNITDPRVSPVAASYSNNPALVIRDYLTDTTYGLGIDASMIDDTAIATAASICEESIDVPDGAGGTTTINRYACDGVINTARTPAEIMSDLLGCCAGSLVWTQGKYVLTVGKYVAPTITIDENDIRGNVQLIARTPRRDLFNGVRGTFIDSENEYALTDFPPYLNSTYVTSDGGFEIYRDLDLPFTQNVYRAQMLAKQMLDRSRQSEVLTLECKYTVLQLRMGDTVSVNLNYLGYSSRIFKIIDWALGQDGIDLRLQAEASSAYAWTDTDATEITELPASYLPNPFLAEPPSEVTASEVIVDLGDGTVNAEIKVTWTASDYQLTENYEVRFKLSTDSLYQVFVVDNDTTEVRVQNGKAGATYDIDVRAKNHQGVASSWVSSGGITLSGKTATPTAATGFSISEELGGVVLTWSNPSDADYSYTEVFRATSNNRSAASSVAKVHGEKIYLEQTPGSTYYYWIRVTNTSGVNSAYTPDTPTGSPIVYTTTVTGSAKSPAGNTNIAPFKYSIFELSNADPYSATLNTSNRSTTYFKFGSQSLDIIPDVVVAYVWFADGASDFNVDIDTGKVWIYSLWAKTPNTGEDGFKLCYTLNDGSSPQVVNVGSIIQPSDTNWNRYSLEIDLSADSTTESLMIGIQFAADADASAPNYYIDGVMFEEKVGTQPTPSTFSHPPLPYKDGLIISELIADTVTGKTLQTASSGKRFVVSHADNEAHFYGANGESPERVGELCSIGISNYGSDSVVLQIGESPQLSQRGIVVQSVGFDAILGYNYGSSGVGISANSVNNFGLSASSGGSAGIYSTTGGFNKYGIGIKAWHSGTANTGTPLLMKCSSSAAAPTHEAFKGSFWLTSAGILYINTSSGGSPSVGLDYGTTWSKVGAQ